MVSHHSAAALWGIPLGGPWPFAVHVLERPDSHARAEGFTVVRWGWAELADRGRLQRLLLDARLPVIH